MNRIVSTISYKIGIVFFVALTIFGCASLGRETDESNVREPKEKLVLKPGQGALWFPAIWSVGLYQGGQGEVMGDALSELRLREVRLVLRNTQTQEETPILGRALDPEEPESATKLDGSSSAALDLDNLKSVFAFGPLSVIPAGQYTVEAFQAEVIDTTTERPQTLSLPIAHPLDAEETAPLTLDIKSESVAVVGRIAFETEFGIRQGKLTAQTRGENLERGRISAESLLLDLGISQSGGLASFPYPMVKANALVSEFRQSIPVLSSTSSEIPRGLLPVGFSLKVPCELEAVVKFVFRYDGSAQEHVALVNLDPTQIGSGCQEGLREESFLLLFEPENVLLLATEIVSGARIVSNSRLRVLSQPDDSVQRFFGMERTSDFLISRIEGEQQLSRRFSLPLKDLRVSQGQKFFAGAFSLESADKSSTTRVWTLLLQKRFETQNLTSAFGVSQIWNPYSGSRIEVPRKEGRIEAVLEVSAAANKTETLSTFVENIRKNLTKSFAACVEKAEELDPLVVTSGTVDFRFRAKQKAGSINDFKLIPGSSSQSIETCFRSAFDVFRFASPSPAAFEGLLRLEAK